MTIRARAIEALREYGPQTRRDLASRLGVTNIASLNTLLWQEKKRGAIEADGPLVKIAGDARSATAVADAPTPRAPRLHLVRAAPAPPRMPGHLAALSPPARDLIDDLEAAEKALVALDRWRLRRAFFRIIEPAAALLPPADRPSIDD